MPRGKAASKKVDARQPTLSFGGRTNKVTKASVAPVGKASIDGDKAKKVVEEAKVTVPPVNEIEKQEEEDEDEDEDDEEEEEEEEEVKEEADATTSKIALRSQKVVQAPELVDAHTEEEKKALEITEKQLKAYWQDKEDARIAPRVHQEDLTLHDKILREFDLTYHYGPCVGISRTKRWKRAHALELEPPLEVLAVLLNEEAKGKGSVETAYVDQLLATRSQED